MIETQTFVRKPFPKIQAVQVTAENLEEVAKWCQGDVRNNKSGRYIKVRVHNPKTPRQTQAYVGDWVLYAMKGYKVYNNRAFLKSFQPDVEEKSLQMTTDDVIEIGDAPQELRSTTEKAS